MKIVKHAWCCCEPGTHQLLISSSRCDVWCLYQVNVPSLLALCLVSTSSWRRVAPSLPHFRKLILVSKQRVETERSWRFSRRIVLVLQASVMSHDKSSACSTIHADKHHEYSYFLCCSWRQGGPAALLVRLPEEDSRSGVRGGLLRQEPPAAGEGWAAPVAEGGASAACGGPGKQAGEPPDLLTVIIILHLWECLLQIQISAATSFQTTKICPGG